MRRGDEMEREESCCTYNSRDLKVDVMTSAIS